MLRSVSWPAQAYADGQPPTLPPELEVEIPRLPRVPSVDEASFTPATTLARGTATLEVTLDTPPTRDDLEVVVLDGRSGAELGRAAAEAGAIAFDRLPFGEHAVLLTRRDQPARRAYLARRVARIDDRGGRCRLPTAIGSLTVLVEAGAKPPILELARPEDPDWHAEGHTEATARSDGILRVEFDDLGDGGYLLVIHGIEPEDRPRPITIAGDTMISIGR